LESIPGGYRVIDANGVALAHVYGEPPNAIAISDKRLTNNEAEKIARLIARLPELVELEKGRNMARSRRKPQSVRFLEWTALGRHALMLPLVSGE
jgi:hypothetical protein